MKWKNYTFIFLLLLIPLSSALTITDTTFSTSGTNYTIFVDSITLDNVTVTSTQILFINLTSVGSNFTNTNGTFSSVAGFIGLDVGLIVFNVNTSTDIFTSSSGNRDFNGTMLPGIVLRITDRAFIICTGTERSILQLTVLFFILAVVFIPLILFFLKGKLNFDVNAKSILVVFILIILGIVFAQVISDSVVSFCG